MDLKRKFDDDIAAVEAELESIKAKKSKVIEDAQEINLQLAKLKTDAEGLQDSIRLLHNQEDEVDNRRRMFMLARCRADKTEWGLYLNQYENMRCDNDEKHSTNYVNNHDSFTRDLADAYIRYNHRDLEAIIDFCLNNSMTGVFGDAPFYTFYKKAPELEAAMFLQKLFEFAHTSNIPRLEMSWTHAARGLFVYVYMKRSFRSTKIWDALVPEIQRGSFIDPHKHLAILLKHQRPVLTSDSGRQKFAISNF
jgi:hypothetical protein